MFEKYDAMESEVFSRSTVGQDFESEMGNGHFRVKGTNDTWESAKYVYCQLPSCYMHY